MKLDFGVFKEELGELSPISIVEKLTLIYGEDKTFAVPIVMALAVSGRLGSEPSCWQYVESLPFELAAAPMEWYQYLKMSVVSYAIPALISIGIVKHRFSSKVGLRPWLRSILENRCMRKLEYVRPP